MLYPALAFTVEIELKATIININMHPKAIDFDMEVK